MKSSFHLSLLSISALLSAMPITSYAGEILRLKAGDTRLRSDSVSRIDSKVNHFIVQFKNKILPKEEAQLGAEGLEILRYLPDDALVVRGTFQALQIAKSKNPGIRAVSGFDPSWKISAETTGIFDAHSTNKLLITAFDDNEANAVSMQIMKIPGTTLLSLAGRSLIVEASASSIGHISQLEQIEWLEPLPQAETYDFKVSPEDRNLVSAIAAAPPELTGYESGTKIMNFEAAWARGFHGEGQIVAMGDTGVDRGDLRGIHADLKAVIKGYPMGGFSTSWEDPMGHGTHVCGSVVGNGANSNSSIRGGAYAAQMLVASLWSPILNNLGFDSDFKKLIGIPYNDGARVHTNSWGAPANPGVYNNWAMQVDDYMWQNPEMLVVFAAGNGGVDLDRDGRIDEGSVSSPATAKNVLTVGASENLLLKGGIQKQLHELRNGETNWGVEPIRSDTLSNNPNGLAAFSSRGPTKDGRTKPEVVSPGTNIVSARSHHPKAELLWGEYDAEYVYSGGTSMATPLTAGAAAVVRQYLVQEQKVSQPSAALVKAVLMHTAKDLYPGQYGTGATQELPTKRPNVHEGYGRVDMDQATALKAGTQVIDDKTGVGTSEERSITVSLAEGESLRATLVYTDAPGSLTAAKALVNDLDLVILGPSGEKFEKADRVNNSEMLELLALKAGNYQVKVTGFSVPMGKNGKQPYALLISH